MMATWIASVIYVGREYRIKEEAVLKLEREAKLSPESTELFETAAEPEEELATTLS